MLVSVLERKERKIPPLTVKGKGSFTLLSTSSFSIFRIKKKKKTMKLPIRDVDDVSDVDLNSSCG